MPFIRVIHSVVQERDWIEYIPARSLVSYTTNPREVCLKNREHARTKRKEEEEEEGAPIFFDNSPVGLRTRTN